MASLTRRPRTARRLAKVATRWDPVSKQFLAADHPAIVAVDAAKAAAQAVKREASRATWQWAVDSLKEHEARQAAAEHERCVLEFMRTTGQPRENF
jgi:hypothetical protein